MGEGLDIAEDNISAIQTRSASTSGCLPVAPVSAPARRRCH